MTTPPSPTSDAISRRRTTVFAQLGCAGQVGRGAGVAPAGARDPSETGRRQPVRSPPQPQPGGLRDACCHALLSSFAGRPAASVPAAEEANEAEQAMSRANAGVRHGLPQPQGVPDGARPQPAPQPARLSGTFDGPELSERPDCHGSMNDWPVPCQRVLKSSGPETNAPQTAFNSAHLSCEEVQRQ